jgi:hypothetical protein
MALAINSPAPANVPTIAEHQSVAAVLRPRTLIPSRRITPAPRKPIPETIWAATWVGLLSLERVVEKMTKPAAPIETSALVRSPAIRCRHCRSKPMTALTSRAVPSRIAISRGAIAAFPFRIYGDPANIAADVAPG